MNTVRIIIADDHPMVREGLEAMLTSAGGFVVAALAADGKAAVEAVAKESPDIVLSDVRMPERDGFALLEAVKKARPSTKVLFLAGMPLKEEESRAEAMGASGYLPKDVDLKRLVSAIESIAHGDGVFVREEFQPAPSPLTARETDVLRLVALGKQRDMIAEELGIGSESVKTHMKGIMNKLGCPNATSAVGKAYELGILRA